MVPAELRYTKSHEWVGMDESANIVTVGITDFAVEQLGDVVYLELPAVGDGVKAGEPFGVIESVKAAVDLNSPVTGEVVESNQALADDWTALGEDPFKKGWMIKIKVDSDEEFKALISAAEYEKFIKEEGGH